MAVRKDTTSVLLTTPTSNQADQDRSALSTSNRKEVKMSSSKAAFKDRMSRFFDTVLHRPLPDDVLRPRPNNDGLILRNEPHTDSDLSDSTSALPLSRAQQEYFLGDYWQFCHCSMPILREATFRECFESLWSDSSSRDVERRPSALADIILAVAMQRAANFLPRDAGVHRTKREANTQDASVAGRLYFQRCQAALTGALEEPTLATLQCYVLSGVYLNNASLPNAAYQILGLAARIACGLDANERSTSKPSLAEHELRRRIWWFLHTLDVRQFIDLGRPCTMERSRNKQYPDDCAEDAKIFGECSSPGKGVTSLSFFVQFSKLFDATRTVYTSFQTELQKLEPSGPERHQSDNAKDLEKSAACFFECLKPLWCWIDNLPADLQTRRKRNGKPFSTDGTPIDLDSGLAVWLTRHRLFLEAFYHKILTDLYRFFISFTQNRGSALPLTKGHSVSCVNHAIALTSIIHQALMESDIINGWYDAHHLQWDATLSMLGFVFAYPSDPLTTSASKMLDVAISIFDILGTKISAAMRAAQLTREMKSIAVQRFGQRKGSDCTGSTVPSLSSKGSSSSSSRTTENSQHSPSQAQPRTTFSTPDWTIPTKSGTTAPTANLEDPFVLDINTFDPSWVPMTDPEWYTDHRELGMESDRGIRRIFQLDPDIGGETEHLQLTV